MASKPQKLPEQSTRYPVVQTKVLIKRMLAERNMTYTEIQKELEYHKIRLYRTPTCYKYAIK